MKIEQLEFEVAQLKKRNQELHRRLQKKESPWQSEVNSLRLRLEWKEGSERFAFRRMCNAHNELKQIFKMVAPLYDLPCRSFHSVMDINFNNNISDGIWANVYLTKRGGVESYNVVDTVRRIVDEMWKLRD